MTKMTEEVKSEICVKLTFESTRNGMSDTKWQKVAERISKKYGVSVEEIYEEYDKQFKTVLRMLKRRNMI